MLGFLRFIHEIDPNLSSSYPKSATKMTVTYYRPAMEILCSVADILLMTVKNLSEKTLSL